MKTPFYIKIFTVIIKDKRRYMCFYTCIYHVNYNHTINTDQGKFPKP